MDFSQYYIIIIVNVQFLFIIMVYVVCILKWTHLHNLITYILLCLYKMLYFTIILVKTVQLFYIFTIIRI